VKIVRLRQRLRSRFNQYRRVRNTSAAQLARENASNWQQVYPEQKSTWPHVLPSGPVPTLFSERLGETSLPKGVLRLRRASVWSDDGWIFTADGRRISDTTAYAEDPESMPRVHLPLFRSGERRLSGRTLSLLSNWGTGNFFHMLLDVLPRIDLLFRTGWTWTDFDHILLPAFRSPTIDRLLAALNLPQAKIIAVKWGQLIYFRCDELICTSYPGGRRAVMPTVVDYLRRLTPPRTARTGRRLFVRRLASTRSLRNESELLPLLTEHGFEVIDPGAISDAETVFHESDYIVGPHGAALANLVFCRPGTKVLELVPTDHAYPYFFTISIGAGLHYDCLLGRSDHETIRPLVSRWTSKSDFTVEPIEFARSLNRLMG